MREPAVYIEKVCHWCAQPIRVLLLGAASASCLSVALLCSVASSLDMSCPEHQFAQRLSTFYGAMRCRLVVGVGAWPFAVHAEFARLTPTATYMTKVTYVNGLQMLSNKPVCSLAITPSFPLQRCCLHEYLIYCSHVNC